MVKSKQSSEWSKPTFLRIHELSSRLSVSVRGIHDSIKDDPSFPKPVKLGIAPQSPLGFVISEVEAYEQVLMARRNINKDAP